MAKKTAIIDIGSNSISLVVYLKSSRFAFTLINKSRAGVRIGEGAYEHGGVLQEEAMNRAFMALKDLIKISSSLKCQKVLTVATSALRDAPNRSVFLNRVKKELNLSLKVIDGKKEAYFGGVAAVNLLYELDSFVSVDIGGGSTEFAKVENGVIVDTYSLNIGTVRLKELFFDKNVEIKKVESFIDEVLEELPSRFRAETIVGIGGTLRALSKSIMHMQDYPIESLHGFEYRVKDHIKFIKSIPSMSDKELKKVEIPSNRIDTIREGVSIFYRILKRFDSKRVIASKAGVREGVYLSDLLRTTHHKFPHNFNVSIRSLIDQFALNPKNCSYVQRLAHDLFDVLKPLHNCKEKYKKLIGYSAKLSPINSRLNIYSNSGNSFYLFLEYLNFGFRHEEKLLIALLLNISYKQKKRANEYKRYKELLPEQDTFTWLFYILAIVKAINANRHIQKVSFALVNDKSLEIYMEDDSILTRQKLQKLELPFEVTLKLSS